MKNKCILFLILFFIFNSLSCFAGAGNLPDCLDAAAPACRGVCTGPTTCRPDIVSGICTCQCPDFVVLPACPSCQGFDTAVCKCVLCQFTCYAHNVSDDYNPSWTCPEGKVCSLDTQGFYYVCRDPE